MPSDEQYPQGAQGISVVKLAEIVDFARDCQNRDWRPGKISEFVLLKVAFSDYFSFVLWCELGD
jgi:hypothetical protein